MAQRMDVQYIRLYTVGSAALKLESATPEKKPVEQRRPRKLKCRKIYVDPVAMLSIVVAVCMLVMMTVGFVQLRRAQAQAAVMESYVERLQAENAVLSAEYKAGYNLEEIRRSALAMDMIPMEQAAHITIQVPEEPEQAEQPSVWEQIGTFLTGLFA